MDGAGAAWPSPQAVWFSAVSSSSETRAAEERTSASSSLVTTHGTGKLWGHTRAEGRTRLGWWRNVPEVPCQGQRAKILEQVLGNGFERPWANYNLALPQFPHP